MLFAAYPSGDADKRVSDVSVELGHERGLRFKCMNHSQQRNIWESLKP